MTDNSQKSVPEMLREGAATYEERNKIYGSNYKKFGVAFAPLLAGITLNTATDVNRMGVLIQMLSKISRYVENWAKGGHDDSLLDLSVYTTMLRELDNEARGQLELDLTQLRQP